MAYRLRHFTATLLLRVLRITLLLLLLVIFGVGLVLLNPHWLVGIVQNELAYQGIQAEITDVDVKFSGTTYRLQSNARASSDYGVQVRHAHLDATIDWYAIWQRQPFIVKAALRDADVVVDRKELSQHFKGKGGKALDLSSILPVNWSIQQGRLSIDGHQLVINANGNQDKHVLATLADDKSGELQANYSKINHQINLSSQHMDLTALTGYTAILRNATVNIDTKEWLNSEVFTELEYQNIISDIRIKQVNGRIQVTAQAADKTAKAEIALQGDTATVYFDTLDLEIYELLKPLIPVKLNISDLGGQAAGQVQFNKQRIISATLKLTDLQLRHPAFVMDNADINMQLENGIVAYQIALRDSELLLPTVFEQDSNRLNGQITGRVDIADSTLFIKDLTLNGQDFEQLSAAGSVQWLAEKNSVLLDIQGQAQNANIANSRRYLPYQMPTAAKTWLADALVSGTQNHTQFTLAGDPKTYKADGFVLRIDTDFKDSVFRYLKKDPDIHFQSGHFAMEGRKIWVNSNHANIGGLPITAKAYIDNVLKTEVDVKAKMRQQSADKMLKVARQTLVKQTIRGVEKIVKPTGRFDLDLSLFLGFHSGKITSDFNIELLSDKATATLLHFPKLPLHKAKTQVLITRKGLQSVTASGQMQGEPLDLSVTAKKKGYDVKVSTTTEAVTMLNKLNVLTSDQSKALQKAQLISGKAHFDSDIRLDAKGNLQTLSVQSNLQGASINIFSAMKKSATKKLPLNLHYDSKKNRLKATLGQANIQVGMNKKGRLTGVLLNNRYAKKRYQAGQLQFYWQSKQFDCQAFERFRQAITPQASKQAQPHLPYHVAVLIQAVKLPNGKRYAIAAEGDEHSIHVTSPILTGVFDFQGKRLHGNIQRLAIDELFQLNSKVDVNPAGREVKSLGLDKALPPLTLLADSVYLKGKNIGNASLRTSENNGHYSIDQFLLSGKNYFIELSGYEATEPQPQGMTTHIQADFKGEKLRDVTQTLGLNDIIDARSLDASLSLSWPGKAHTLNIQQSYGSASLTAQNLKMLNIDTGVGGLFGLMDITGILKRVSLDFKNVTSSKIAFDKLQGDWNIGGGRAMTRDFSAEGSLIAMKLAGPVDLYRREFDDVEMIVIPKTSNVLPVVGVVTGGVVGGVIGLAVQQVFGKQIDEVIGLPYLISGKWEAPKVTFQGQGEAATQKQSAQQRNITQPTHTAEQTTMTLESLQDSLDENIGGQAIDTTMPQKLQTKPDEQPMKEWLPDSNWQPEQYLETEQPNG